MALKETEEFFSHHLGHLGLIADKMDDLGLIDLIDSRLPVSLECGAKLTHGERIMAMIFNGLGFIDTRLYLFSEFLHDKPLDLLFERDVQAEWFNDDALGRCLDAISGYGVNKLFTELSLHIGQAKGLLGKSIHIDTTTLSLYGDYEGVVAEDQPHPMQGYAKSGRHDLKQMVLLLATTGASNFPICMEAHSGNTSDQVSMPNAAVKMKALCENIAGAEDFIYVGDSAMYANIIQHSEDMIWISRVPERISEAKKWVTTLEQELSFETMDDCYSYCSKIMTYQGVAQRWVMIHSQAAQHRETKTLDKKIAKEYETQNKLWWHLSNRTFTCSQDAQNEAMKQSKLLKYHTIEFLVQEDKKHSGRGRPKKDEKPQVTGYKIEYTLKQDAPRIEQAQASKGRFILGSNQTNRDILSEVDILREYKAQSGVERGFKFIKDNTFQVDSVFLKTPERIEALMMVMTLCLMVYGVSEYDLHQSLQASNATIKNQVQKQTNKPSLKWVYFLFRVATVLYQKVDGIVVKKILNINPLLRKVINHFGPRARAIYLNPA